MIKRVIRLSHSDHEVEVIPTQADNDEQVVSLWLHGRSRHTQRAYLADVNRFFEHVGMKMHAVTLGDLQGYADDLNDQPIKPRTIHRALSAVKSLFGFAHRLGYLPFDTAKPLRLPTLKEGLAERILDESQVQRMIALEPNPRNRAMLLLLYATGVRVSELCGLQWKDCQARDKGGQVSVHGKGGKTRSIRIPSSVWHAIMALSESRSSQAYVFKSRKGGGLSAAQVSRLVRKAAERAEVGKSVTAHWLRHAHASHALDRQAPIHLVQQTLGHASVATTGRYLHARPNESSSKFLPL